MLVMEYLVNMLVADAGNTAWGDGGGIAATDSGPHLKCWQAASRDQQHPGL